LAEGRETIISAHNRKVVISTHNNDVLLYGNRLRLLRESRNVTQQELALALGVGTDEIKQMERGIVMCSAQRIAVIRNALDAEFLPLTNDEIPAFRERLYIWRDMIRNRKIDEATELQRKIAGIVDLDVDFRLISLYRMFEITLLIVQGDFDQAAMKLESIDKALIDKESQYYYFRNKGTIWYVQGDYENALRYFYNALVIGESEAHILKDDDSIYFNIAACYYSLHLPNHAIKFLEESEKERTDRTSLFGWHLDCVLAVNFIRIKQLPEAEMLLQKCLTFAEASGDKSLTAIALHNFGFMHHTAENWLLAVSYYSRASELHVHGTTLYLDSLYGNIRCCIELGDYAECTKLLEVFSEHLSKNKNSQLGGGSKPLYATLHESLSCLMFITQDKVDADNNRIPGNMADFIMDKAVPLLIDEYRYTHALDYCEILCNFFEKTSTLDKALAIKSIAMDIYKKMLYYRRD